MLIHGDCLEQLKKLDENSIDAVVTDPPYGLKFMGKQWDYDVPGVDIWREVLRVLKPGGHLLSFGGTRTYHRMVVAIEDAGFEIRDQVQWLYGSGFPKSRDIAKDFDKGLREVIGTHEGSGLTKSNAVQGAQQRLTTEWAKYSNEAVSDLAKQWQGWGTALKPANEPIVLARKPLSEKTVAANVLRWGTGALNIDASRIGTEQIESGRAGRSECESEAYGKKLMDTPKAFSTGRWPANLLLDEESAALLDVQSGHLVGAGNKKPSPVGKGTFGMGERVQGGKKLDNGGGAGVAAARMGYRFIGIEMSEEYLAIAEKRIEHEIG